MGQKRYTFAINPEVDKRIAEELDGQPKNRRSDRIRDLLLKGLAAEGSAAPGQPASAPLPGMVSPAWRRQVLVKVDEPEGSTSADDDELSYGPVEE